MITGAHTLLYTTKPDEMRAFFGDVLGLRSLDAGGGWLIFALPPAEVAVHPSASGSEHHELTLMCDDIEATVIDLRGARRAVRGQRRGSRLGTHHPARAAGRDADDALRAPSPGGRDAERLIRRYV